MIWVKSLVKEFPFHRSLTVRLDSNGESCRGVGCGDGEVTNDVVTVCIGCKGFDPVEIEPSDVEILTEAFRVENIDRL